MNTQCWLALVLILAASGCDRVVPPSEAESTREIRVAAASDLRFAFDEIVFEFQREHPEVRVNPTYGSSGNFFTQIANGAPFDLYLSADIDYPRRLIEAGLAKRESEFIYAIGQIVVWARSDSTFEVEHGLQLLLDSNVRKVAIANPEHAPYGRAAEAALRKIEIYDDVRNKLVLGETVSQAAQFVASGAADVGIIALSLAMAPAMQKQGRFWLVSPQDYPKMEQGGVILSKSKHVEDVLLLRSFMLGARGREILGRYGFGLPEE